MNSAAGDRPDARTLMAVAAQLAMACLVVWLYEIEGPAFLRVFLLAAGGFLVNLWLLPSWRMPFFVLLSLAGVFLVFEPADGAWLIAAGLALVGLCHVPGPAKLRIALLLGAGGLLVASRAGVMGAPWSALVWPILGSMFMFRLALYAKAIPAEPRPGRFWAALGYFFMLPNLVFPLFPVIDYQTFRRTHYDKPAGPIYQQGMLWIARGLVHLVLYRLIYHRVLNDAVDVESLGDLVQFLLGTFLLYLRVSGMFHLIVGMLHLFGFRLPETHKLYYLAHSFTELWRRINIYWKDFMMSFVFYPVYFRVRRWGPAVSVGVATAAVFVTTWVLHSYQWFWLRGGFPVTPQDVLFWGLLGGLVVIGALRELKSGPKSRQQTGGWNLRSGLKAFATFSVFCFLWSLWSTESVGEWLWTLGAAGRVDAEGLALLALMFVVLVGLGGRNWDAPGRDDPRWLQAIQGTGVRTTVPLVILLALALAPVERFLPAQAVETMALLRSTSLNVRDAALQHRGYYEQLDVRAQLTAQALEGPGARRDDWKELSSTGVLRIRDDFLERDLLPGRSVTWNGLSFSTNRWGMRDRDYPADKPAGTLRIALLGPSHVMGNGVADGEAFESLVEDRLNRERPVEGYDRYEMLNFGVDGYCLAQQLAILEDRVLEFAPDVVIATSYHANAVMTQVFVQKIVLRGIAVPYPEVDALLRAAGLDESSSGSLPVPFPAWRAAARAVGLDPRMPHAESQARIRRVAPQLSAWSVARIAAVSRAYGAIPAILAMDAILDRPSESVPEADAIEAAALPVFNLLDVFPADRRDALRVAPWDEHPNAAGHELIARRMYPELKDFLTTEFGPR